jgi:hypothetical protein
MKIKSARKPSWQYLDLSFKIQVPTRYESKKLLLIFLAAKADNHGRSYHGYASIRAHLGFNSQSTVSGALKYLRDELGVLSWRHGSGGFGKKDTNLYQLDLEAMRDVVTSQGVFDPTTGRLTKYEVESTECTQSSPVNGLSVESTEQQVESTEQQVESTERTSRVHSVDTNPQEPSEKPTPRKSNPSGVRKFFAESPSSDIGRTESKAATLPPVPFTPKRVRLLTGSDAHYLDVSSGQRLPYLATKQAVESGLAVQVTQ